MGSLPSRRSSSSGTLNYATFTIRAQWSHAGCADGGKEVSHRFAGFGPAHGCDGVRRHLSDGVVNDFIGYAERYQIEADRQRARAALILAYRPLQLWFDDGADKKAFLADLMGRRHLLRGAFLAYAVAREPRFALKETA